MYPCIAENHRRVALQTHRDAQYEVGVRPGFTDGRKIDVATLCLSVFLRRALSGSLQTKHK